MPRVEIVGVGPGHPDYLTLRGCRLIGQADVVAGFRSVLDGVSAWIRGRTLAMSYENQDAVLAEVAARARRGEACVVCAHGDPGVSGRELVERVKAYAGEVGITPGVSSVQVACALLGLAVEEALLVTFHKRVASRGDLQELCGAVRAGTRHVVALPRPWDFMPAAMARSLLEAGVPAHRPVHVLQRLTLVGERCTRHTVGELARSEEPFSDLSIVVVKAGEEVRRCPPATA